MSAAAQPVYDWSATITNPSCEVVDIDWQESDQNTYTANTTTTTTTTTTATTTTTTTTTTTATTTTTTTTTVAVEEDEQAVCLARISRIVDDLAVFVAMTEATSEALDAFDLDTMQPLYTEATDLLYDITAESDSLFDQCTEWITDTEAADAQANIIELNAAWLTLFVACIEELEPLGFRC